MAKAEAGILTRERKETGIGVLEELPYMLIVWNDEVNTFEWVIQSLMEICRHSFEQAEQSALIIHFQGKYAVKQGAFEEVRPMCEALLDRGISATVEQVSGAESGV